jgi:predicted RNA-binding Zn ribbon-like protein
MAEGLPVVESDYEFVGNNLALDFANTVNDHGSEHPGELVHSYADLARWGQEAGIVTNEENAALLAEAERRPADAVRVLAEARRLREAVFGLFDSLSRGGQADPAALAILNGSLNQALPHLRVSSDEHGFGWAWNAHAHDLDQIVWPVARAAAELLVSAELERVRVCSDDTCGWLFIDTTRNRSRRWCTMESCGNRAKARRHYEQERRARKSG